MRSELAYLTDNLDACTAIANRVKGYHYKSFKASEVVYDSICYRLMVIGEASRNIDLPTQQLMPEIPWQQLRRMRNVLVHDYDGVDARIVWDVIENHLPPLVIAIQRVLSSGRLT